jgi:hypothetical protein
MSTTNNPHLASHTMKTSPYTYSSIANHLYSPATPITMIYFLEMFLLPIVAEFPIDTITDLTIQLDRYLALVYFTMTLNFAAMEAVASQQSGMIDRVVQQQLSDQQDAALSLSLQSIPTTIVHTWINSFGTIDSTSRRHSTTPLPSRSTKHTNSTPVSFDTPFYSPFTKRNSIAFGSSSSGQPRWTLASTKDVVARRASQASLALEWGGGTGRGVPRASAVLV